MNRKHILDAMIILLAIVCIISIFNSSKADNGNNVTTDNNVTTNNNITANNTVENTTVENTDEEKPELDCSSGVVGDVTGDKIINAIDATHILIYVAHNEVNYIKPTDEEISVADIDKDGKITAIDAGYILKYSAVAGSGGNPTWDSILSGQE